MVFSCSNIKKSYGSKEILKKVEFSIEKGQKLALIGINGAGKTTIFKIILGKEEHDSGDIFFKKGITISHLSQDFDLDFDKTIYEELLSTFYDLIIIQNQIRDLEIQMENCEGLKLKNILEKYSILNDKFEKNRGYEIESRVKGVLYGLGFSKEQKLLKIKNLSGGQKTRVSLGKMLLKSPDLLLLDEPTNHLDIDSIYWLENYLLKEYQNSVIIISHDRYFLDSVVDSVVEIEHGFSKFYNGNYTDFVEKKSIDREIELKHYNSQQKEIKKQEESIALLRSFNREKSIRRARSKEKQLAKIEKIEKPLDIPDRMRFNINPKIQSGNDVLLVKRAAKKFGEYILFKNINMDIKKGDKVAIIGENGIGKTTLFNMILNQDTGIKIGTNVFIGYYDQQMINLDHSKTIMQEISDSYPKLKNLEIRNALASFLFVGDDIFKYISSLSGGERARVSLAKLMLSDSNFLLLDEPTNHLDLFSKEILENAIINYKGTVLYISHDRYFINNTAEKIYEFKKDCANLYLGNYDYYIEKKAGLNIENNENKIERKEKGNLKNIKPISKSTVERIEKEIIKKELEIENLNKELEKEEIYTDYIKSQSILDEKGNIEKELEKLYSKLI